MTFAPIWFATWLLYIAMPIYAIVLANALRPQNLSKWTHRRFAVAGGAMLLLWCFQVQTDAGQMSGMSYHLLGVSWAALLLGTSGAWVLGSVFLLMFGVIQHGLGFVNVFALNALCVLLPACGVNALFRFGVKRFLPKQLFIYIFLCGFGSAGVGMLLTGLSITSILDWAGVFDLFGKNRVWESIFPVFFLMTWGEAFLSGLGTAILVALKPEFLGTFDDKEYLSSPKKTIWTDTDNQDNH